MRWVAPSRTMPITPNPKASPRRLSTSVLSTRGESSGTRIATSRSSRWYSSRRLGAGKKEFRLDLQRVELLAGPLDQQDVVPLQRQLFQVGPHHAPAPPDGQHDHAKAAAKVDLLQRLAQQRRLGRKLQLGQVDLGREQLLDGQVVVFHDQDAPPAQLGQAVGPAFDQQPVAGAEDGSRAGSQLVLVGAQDGQDVQAQGRAQAALSQRLAGQGRIRPADGRRTAARAGQRTRPGPPDRSLADP